MSYSRINLKRFNRIVAFIWALTPFTQHYVVPGVGSNLAFSSLFVLGFIYIIFAVEKKVTPYKQHDTCLVTKTVLVMFLYCSLHLLFYPPTKVYRGAANSMAALVIQFSFLFLCVAVFSNKDARLHYLEYVEFIALLMTAVVALQVLIYIGTGNTFTDNRSFLFPLQGFFTEGVKQTLEGSQMVINGLFRPSAFFIEPAHYSQFCLIGLVVSLTRTEKLFNKKAIIISAGIILTTSGIGILSVLMLWTIKLLITGHGVTNKVIIKCLIGILLLIVAFAVLFTVSTSFKMAVTRILVPSNGYNSALEGRLGSRTLLRELSLTDLLIGRGYQNIPTYGNNIPYYMTGIIEMLYCQGIIGTTLFVLCYISMMIKAFKRKLTLPLYTLLLYIPFLIGTSNLVILSLIQYFPLLYSDSNYAGTDA